MFNKSALISAVVLAARVSAYTYPSFEGNLLIQVGANNAKCLRADNTNGAPVTVADCAGGTDQEWKFGPNGNVALYGGAMCLDVTGGVDADGTKLQVWACGTKNKNQQWNYTKYGDNHLISALPSARCLDLTGGATATGTQVQIWACDNVESLSNQNNQIWDAGYMASALPQTVEAGQTGVNNCGTASSQGSLCQTMWMNGADDFCLWAPRAVGTIGDTERDEVAWCTKSGRGTRVIPDGTLSGVHFIRTKDYVQVTGVGDLTKINVKAGDEGGELDPHGSDSAGNPIGGLVFGSTFSADLQYAEWTSFISATQFCMRACTGPNARENCQHTYDEMGCEWNMPASYSSGKFTSCEADNDLPMGVYGTSTWHQGISPTPTAHPVAASSSCTTYASVTSAPAKRDYSQDKLVKRGHAAHVHAARITARAFF